MENQLHKFEGLINFVKRENTGLFGNKSLVQESSALRKIEMARILHSLSLSLSLSLSVGVYG
jgi:hypothetical protein